MRHIKKPLPHASLSLLITSYHNQNQSQELFLFKKKGERRSQGTIDKK